MKRASLIAFAVLAFGSAATAATGVVSFPPAVDASGSAPLVQLAAASGRAAPMPRERAEPEAPSVTTGREQNTAPADRGEAPSKPARRR